MGVTPKRNRIKMGKENREGKKNILEVPARMLELHYRHKEQHRLLQLGPSGPQVTLKFKHVEL